MNSKITELMSRISHLEGQPEAELAKRRAELKYGLDAGGSFASRKSHEVIESFESVWADIR